MDTKIEALVNKMEHARGRLNSALDKVKPQVEIYPTWKLKQIMDHITGWDELMLTSLRAYAQGQNPPRAVKNGIDQYNAESVNARTALSLEQSRQAFDKTREQVIQTLREISPDMLTERFNAPWGGKCTITSVVKIFVSHESEHAKQIEEILMHSTQTI